MEGVLAEIVADVVSQYECAPDERAAIVRYLLKEDGHAISTGERAHGV